MHNDLTKTTLLFKRAN